LLHELLGIPSFAALEAHPKLGASWEGFALEEVLRIVGDREAYFWNTRVEQSSICCRSSARNAAVSSSSMPTRPR
jgi:hypothetical protein